MVLVLLQSLKCNKKNQTASSTCNRLVHIVYHSIQYNTYKVNQIQTPFFNTFLHSTAIPWPCFWMVLLILCSVPLHGPKQQNIYFPLLVLHLHWHTLAMPGRARFDLGLTRPHRQPAQLLRLKRHTCRFWSKWEMKLVRQCVINPC